MLNGDGELSTEMVRDAFEAYWRTADPGRVDDMTAAFDRWLGSRTVENDAQVELARRVADGLERDGAACPSWMSSPLIHNPALCVGAQRVLADTGDAGIMTQLASNPNLHSDVTAILLDAAFELCGDATTRRTGEGLMYPLIACQRLTDDQQTRIASRAPYESRRLMAWPWLRYDRSVPLCARARKTFAKDRSVRIRRLMDYWDDQGYPLDRSLEARADVKTYR